MEKNRVIILGSGPTGLITAWKLLEKGLNVLIIEKNLNLGLNLNMVLENFENKRKNLNFLFAMGVDFLHEFFKVINKYDMKTVDKFFKFMNKNSHIKKRIEKLAEKGFDL